MEESGRLDLLSVDIVVLLVVDSCKLHTASFIPHRANRMKKKCCKHGKVTVAMGTTFSQSEATLIPYQPIRSHFDYISANQKSLKFPFSQSEVAWIPLQPIRSHFNYLSANQKPLKFPFSQSEVALIPLQPIRSHFDSSFMRNSSLSNILEKFPHSKWQRLGFLGLVR